MKALYAKLDSLLPSSTSSREGATLPRPDRLSEAANYIKGMQEKLERMKERKRQLMTRNEAADNSKLPKIEVQNRGSNLYMIQIVSSPDDRAMFYEAVRAVEEEGGEVLNAQFSTTDRKAFHTIYALLLANSSYTYKGNANRIFDRLVVGDFKYRFETGKLKERLKDLERDTETQIKGSIHRVDESRRAEAEAEEEAGARRGDVTGKSGSTAAGDRRAARVEVEAFSAIAAPRRLGRLRPGGGGVGRAKGSGSSGVTGLRTSEGRSSTLGERTSAAPRGENEGEEEEQGRHEGAETFRLLSVLLRRSYSLKAGFGAWGAFAAGGGRVLRGCGGGGGGGGGVGGAGEHLDDLLEGGGLGLDEGGGVGDGVGAGSRRRRRRRRRRAGVGGLWRWVLLVILGFWVVFHGFGCLNGGGGGGDFEDGGGSERVWRVEMASV
ncbi:hypothetical protein ACMD2_25584 [Ananas comosus]|uniref:BHLH domain-containing protein n=1 Tax=Ananas comosus TaxID=4615 RepID=A0A199UW62_ANACO|nr:hypothetical protein ACMD2_25584 [Ananas comosus]